MAKEPCPVDRGKLLIGLECCRSQTAGLCCNCPYWKKLCDTALMEDALAYITAECKSGRIRIRPRRKYIRRAGFVPHEFTVIKELAYSLFIRHRVTGEVKMISKSI